MKNKLIQLKEKINKKCKFNKKNLKKNYKIKKMNYKLFIILFEMIQIPNHKNLKELLLFF